MVDIKKTSKIIGIILLLFFCGGAIKAQQPFTYTQYAENITPVNMAYSLVNPGGALNLIARKQWVGIKGSPSTIIANGYMPWGDNGDMAAGLNILYDNVAVEQLTEANAFLAKAVQVSEQEYLSVSANFGFRRYATNYAQLDPNDPLLKEDVQEIAGNVGFSVMFYGKNEEDENTYYAGVSLPRLNIKVLGGSTGGNQFFKNQYYITGGFTKPINESFKIKPAIVVAYTDNLPLQADISSMVYFQNTFGLGFNYRTNNELAAMLSYSVRENIRVGYSYQMSMGVNKIGGMGNATHEIGLSYRFGDFY